MYYCIRTSNGDNRLLLCYGKKVLLFRRRENAEQVLDWDHGTEIKGPRWYGWTIDTSYWNLSAYPNIYTVYEDKGLDIGVLVKSILRALRESGKRSMTKAQGTPKNITECLDILNRKGYNHVKKLKVFAWYILLGAGKRHYAN